MLRSLGLTFVLFVLVLAFVVTNTGCAGVTAASKASTVTASAAISVSVTPSTVSIQTGGTQQFTATVTGLSEYSCDMVCHGGSVSNTGLYTAPTACRQLYGHRDQRCGFQRIGHRDGDGYHDSGADRDLHHSHYWRHSLPEARSSSRRQ